MPFLLRSINTRSQTRKPGLVAPSRSSLCRIIEDRTEQPLNKYGVIRAPARPIDAQARLWAESRLGCDFSQVRIHTDTEATAAAHAVNARAFTIGRHIVFGAGQHAPNTQQGQRLLTHELIHVMQQEKSIGVNQGDFVQRQPLPPSESNAIAVARQLLEAAKQGRLVLQKRDLQQIEQIAKTGMVQSERGETVVPSDTLVRALQSLLRKTLSDKGGSKPKLGILSLVRFGKKSAHSRGEAVDIHAYGGYSVNMSDPRSALNGTLAVIGDLPSGCYDLGIPRTLPTDKEKLFFPALTLQYKSPSGGRSIEKDMEYIEDAGAREQFRRTIKDAASRGTIIRLLYPDARDHLHIQLAPCIPQRSGKKV